MNRSKKVVIVGAGFAGLEATKTLSKDKSLSITLIDEKNHHLFQPLLYQVATAGLNPADIAFPIRSLFPENPHIEIILGKVTNIDLEEKKISTVHSDINEVHTFFYDYLIMACGVTHSYFGHNEWESYAPGLKTLESAIEIRRRVLLAFENAETLDDRDKQQEFLNFIVVGGGPTGVELAGALAETAHFTLAKDFSHIDPKQTQILLIEGGERILSSFDSSLSLKAQKTLEKLGVKVLTSSIVTDVGKDYVLVGDKKIKSHTILWAAGVRPSSLNQLLNTALDGQGRAIVTPELQLPGDSSIYVIGDQSSFKNEKGEILPGLASVAKQQGHHAAKNILRMIKGMRPTPFRYFDKGQMATIGRNKAVLQMGNIKTHGFLAWVAWLVVHIYYLIGFRNRLFVFISWAWSYLTYGKGARLIISPEWRTFRNGQSKKNL